MPCCGSKCLLPLNRTFLTNPKWDFCLQWKKIFLQHSLCNLPVGHDKPWTHRSLRLHLCGMMQMMTNSFVPHHACVANRRNTQGWADLGTWLRGKLPDWITQEWLPRTCPYHAAVRLLNNLLKQGSIDSHSKPHSPLVQCVMKTHYSHLSQNQLVDSIHILLLSMTDSECHVGDCALYFAVTSRQHGLEWGHSVTSVWL